jgi:hypothetical protein
MKSAFSLAISFLFVLQGIAAQEIQTNIPEQVQKSWAYLIGTWDITGQVGPQEVTGTANFSWSEGKHSYLGRQTWHLGSDARTIHLSLLGGWDPARAVTIEQGFSTMGNAAMVRYRAPTDEKADIEGTIEGVTGPERTWSGSVTIARKGNNEFELNTVIRGETTHSLKYVRRKDR